MDTTADTEAKGKDSNDNNDDDDDDDDVTMTSAATCLLRQKKKNKKKQKEEAVRQQQQLAFQLTMSDMAGGRPALKTLLKLGGSGGSASSSSSSTSSSSKKKTQKHGNQTTKQHAEEQKSKSATAAAAAAAVAASTETAAAAATSVHNLFQYNTRQHVTFFAAQDPTMRQFGEQSTRHKCSLFSATSGGRVYGTAAEFMDFVELLQPDVVRCISDELGAATLGGSGSGSGAVSAKRARRSVDNSIAWQQLCLARLARETPPPMLSAKQLRAQQRKREQAERKRKEQGGAAAAADTITTQTMQEEEKKQQKKLPPGKLYDAAYAPFIFASVEGGADEQARMHCVQRLTTDVDASRIHGFTLGGFGSGESAAERAALLRKLLAKLPASTARFLSGVTGSPLEVLDAVHNGIDVMEAAYPQVMSELGCACTFRFDNDDDDDEVAAEAKINLRDPRFTTDQSPLVADCTCYTCVHHTRGYLHHLLNVHEMLAEVLLDLHNLHHYAAFFAAIRAHVAAGSFVAFRRRVRALLTA
jgi:queuine/archaeosine tRNA-ribosyltransferase